MQREGAPRDGTPAKILVVDDQSAHAEILALRTGAIRRGEWRLEEATLYVTKEPCIMCAGAMVNARLGRLVYGCRDERYGGVSYP